MNRIRNFTFSAEGKKPLTTPTNTITVPAGAIDDFVNFNFTFFPILNVAGSDIGGDGDSSITIGGTVFTNQVAEGTADADMATGDFWVDHLTGNARGKKANSGTSLSWTWKYFGTAEGNAASVDDTTETSIPILGKVYAYLRAYSGTAFQTVRSGLKAVTTSIIGYLAVIPFAVYNAVATVRTEGQSGPIQQDANGNTLVADGAHVTGEDQDIDRMMTVQKFAYTPPFVTDTQVSAAPYILHAITFSCNDAAPTAGTIDVYDNTTGSGTKIFTHTFTTTPFMPFTLIFDIETTLGLYVDMTTTGDVSVAVSGMAAE